MGSSRSGVPVLVVVVLVTLVSLGLYGATMAPSLTLGHGGSDGAELAVAVHTVGIPHPTGYPTYVLLAQGFRALPWGTLAGRLNFFSACAAALTAGTVALAAAVLFRGRETRLPVLVAALTAGLSLTVAGLFWSQALITEVYTLHTLFLALAFWLLLRWRAALNHRAETFGGTGRRVVEASSKGWGGGVTLPLAGLCMGLGLGNHVSLLFLLPGAVLFLVISRRRPRWQDALLAAGLLAVGLSVYAYLPLRAAADPWLNWGDPRDWASFWSHLGGRAYHGFLFRVPWSQVLGRFPVVVRFLWRDFAPWGVLLGLGGILLLGWDDRPVLVLTAVPAGLGLLLAVTYGGAESEAHLLPLYVAWALWVGVAAGKLTVRLYHRFGGKGALAALLLPLLSLALLVRYVPSWSLRGDRGPLPQQAKALGTLPPGGLLLTDTDEETFPLWYAQVVEGARPNLVVVDVRLLEWPWYRRQLPSRYPGLIVPAEAAGEGWLQALLVVNAGRPAFSLDELPLPAGYHLQREEQVYRVVPP